jgi:RnfABCDGE-type electron transport complex B subunit
MEDVDMEWTSIVYPALSIGGLGIVFGLGLGIAGKKFAVEVDPMIPKVRDILPGANCGGCGFAGCDAFAKAVVEGNTKPNGCPVGGAKLSDKISTLLGLENTNDVKKIAYVKCNGTCSKAKEKYEYVGVMDCKNANFLQGKGSKACEYGCLGLGSCVNACMFDAIHIVDGIATVDEEKCTSCGMCVDACPKDLIELIPYESQVRVKCNSTNKGKEVKLSCEVGCIGCRLCTRVCEFEAITVENNIAKIDYEKCTACMKCVEKCPTKAIIVKE